MGIGGLLCDEFGIYPALTSEFLTKLDDISDSTNGTETLSFQLGNAQRSLTIAEVNALFHLANIQFTKVMREQADMSSIL